MSVLMNKAASLENELIDLIAAINNKLLMQKFLDWQDARNEVNDEFQIFLDSFKNIEPNVIRRIYMEMIHERDYVENNPKYTVSYREGYNEAVRCLGVVIKQLTTEDVRQDGVQQ